MLEIIVYAIISLTLLVTLMSLMRQPLPQMGEKTRMGLPLWVLLLGAAGLVACSAGAMLCALMWDAPRLALALASMSALPAALMMAWGRCVLIIMEDGYLLRSVFGRMQFLTAQELAEKKCRWFTRPVRRLLPALGRKG